MAENKLLEKLLLTEKEAAEILGVSVKTLQAWRYKHLPPVYCKINGAIRYPMDGLKNLVEESKVVVRR